MGEVSPGKDAAHRKDSVVGRQRQRFTRKAPAWGPGQPVLDGAGRRLGEMGVAAEWGPIASCESRG